ncbi:MAG: ABC transporter permease subunit [Betaproteobacteria bacterium AqS2]|uniref:ABC transporter permease subunit n=1 Tax=Candidatus Amphirhobacter heronislandensis TaxID=1732024 RepID=A0A930UHG9_9GAMM|nr:ABC transporter permease subunit [Betaproteobacteria bacterium AqS2]
MSASASPRREHPRILLLLAPALVALGLLFGGGLLLGLARSFGYMPLLGLTEPNLDAYRALFADGDFLASFALTFYIAFVSTAVSAVLAIGAALILRRSFAGKRAMLFLFQLNITIPHLVGAIGILYLFSQSGAFARLARELGMIAQPADFPALIYDPAAVGIILQYVWKEIPFIGIVVLASLQAIGEDYEAAARSLGAGRWQRFRHVLLPLMAPGVIAASVIVFAFTFGAYEIPALLGQHHPAALPVLAYRLYTDVDLAARPQAMAMAMAITLLCALLIAGYLYVARRWLRWS